MILMDIKKYLNESDNRERIIKESLNVKKYLVTVQIINGSKTEQKTIETTASSESQAKHQVCDSMGLPISAVIEVKDKGSLIKESLDSDAAGDAYYKVNEAALKLQEVKPYIEEGSEAEKLYNKIMIDLNELQVSFTKSNLNEAMFKDINDNSGIRSYYEMLWGQEPQSEYDKMLLQYMNKHDEIREKLADARKAFGGNMKNPEYKKILQKLAIEDRKNSKLRSDAEKIPAEERGQLYQDFLQIDKANDDDFARKRGYKSFDDYEKANYGLHEEVDSNVVNKLRSSKYYSGEPLVQEYIKLERQKETLEKQGKLTDRVKYEIDRRIEDLLLKSEVTGQKAKEEPKVKHDDDYCNQAAADFVGDKMSDEFGANWRDLPQDKMIEAIKKYTNEYGEANAQPEYANEDFYGDEADYNKVYDILLGRN